VDDIDKYVLEQAKIEIEQTRSWPTKILAFYVAINAGTVTALFSLAGRSSALHAPVFIRVLLTIAVVVLSIWALALLVKNHRSYLRYREIQVQFQIANADTIKSKFSVPPEWLLPVTQRVTTRGLGWTFYAYLVFLVAALGITGIWVS